ARRGAGFSAEERERLLQEVLLVLNDPRFSQVFAVGSRAELPIVGRFTRNGRSISVSGQVDRLAATADCVLIADFKTNRPAPRALSRGIEQGLSRQGCSRGAHLDRDSRAHGDSWRCDG